MKLSRTLPALAQKEARRSKVDDFSCTDAVPLGGKYAQYRGFKIRQYYAGSMKTRQRSYPAFCRKHNILFLDHGKDKSTGRGLGTCKFLSFTSTHMRLEAPSIMLEII